MPTTATAQGEERRTEWRSIFLGAWMSFISSAQFSLYFSSMWPFLKTLDPNATEAFFGTVVAAYSLAQTLASPLLGTWANRIERLRPPLILCNSLMIVGNSFYFFVETFPSSSQKFVLIWARFIVGAGAAQIGLLRAYVAAASTVEDRSRATAFVTGGVAIGTSLGPAFQMVFSGLGYPGITLLFGGRLHLSMFNSPALFAGVLNSLNVCIVLRFFRESYVGIVRRKNSPAKDSTSEASAVPIKLAPPDRTAVRLCYLLRFAQMFIISNLETIGSSFAMLMFLFTPREVVFYDGLAHFARGLMALFIYVVFIVFNLGNRLNDRLVCLSSLVSLLLFHVLTFSWPFLPNDLPENVSAFNLTGSNESVSLGCDRSVHQWCDGLKQVNVFSYYSLITLLIGTAFPLTNISMGPLFSKVIGPRMQAKHQGLMLMCGGTARMIGPLLIGFLYTLYGPQVIWMVECAVILFTFTLWSVFYTRLVPFQLEEERRRTEIGTISKGASVFG